MPLNAHLLYEYDPAVIEHLRGQLDPGIRLTVGDPAGSEGDFHVLIAGRPDRDLLAAHRNLRALIIPWRQFPAETRDLMRDFPNVSIHNISHNAEPVAEMAIALLLAAAKLIIPFDAALRRDDWTPRYEHPAPALLLSGKTAVILGYGEIGKRIARICNSMGMRVLATKRIPPTDGNGDAYVQRLYPPQALPDLLPQAQVLIIAVPLTPETEGLLGAEDLQRLPQGSVLVNIGRAAVVDEQALYEALLNGPLGAAGLDVWYNYPNSEEDRPHTSPSSYPFGTLENVVLSPHRAGLTREIDFLRMDHLAPLLNAAVIGEEMPNRVNLHAGY